MGCGGSHSASKSQKQKTIQGSKNAEFNKDAEGLNHSHSQQTKPQNQSEKTIQIHNEQQKSNEKIDMSQREREVSAAQIPSLNQQNIILESNNLKDKYLQQKITSLIVDKNIVLMNEAQQQEMMKAMRILEEMNLEIDEILSQGYYGYLVQVSKKDEQSKRMTANLLFYNMEGDRILNQNEMNDEKRRKAKEATFNKQVEVMKNFPFPNLASVIDFKQQGDVFIVLMEHCPCTLNQFLRQNKNHSIKQESIFAIWNHLILGMEILHENEEAIGDLSDNNILINDQGVLKFSNFGLGRNFSLHDIVTMNQSSQKTGNMHFQPPELIKRALDNENDQTYSSMSSCCKIKLDKGRDIWALGMIFYLLSGGDREFISAYGQNDSTYKKAPDVDAEANIFIEQILNKDYDKRPSMAKVREDFTNMIQEKSKKMENPKYSDKILKSQFSNDLADNGQSQNSNFIRISNPFRQSQLIQRAQVEKQTQNLIKQQNQSENQQSLEQNQELDNRIEENQQNENKVNQQDTANITEDFSQIQKQDQQLNDYQKQNQYNQQINETQQINEQQQINDQQLNNVQQRVDTIEQIKDFENRDEKYYLSCIERDSSDKLSYIELGIIYMNNQNDYQKAEDCFRKALEIDPMYPLALTNLGNLFKKMKKIEEAESYYQSALKADPLYVDAAFQIGLLYQNELKKYQLSEQYYKMVIDMNPDHLKSHQQLALLYMNDVSKNKEQENHLQIALKLDPNDSQTYHNLGYLNLVQNKIPEAEQNFKKALDFEPNHYSSLLQLGIIYKDYDIQPQLSEDYLRKALLAEPESQSPLFHLGLLNYQQFKNMEQAEFYLKQYLQKAPDNYEGWYNLALTYDNQYYCEPEEAKKQYLKCIKLNRDDIRPYIKLANLYKTKYSDLEKSTEYYRKVLKIKPNNIEGHLGIALACDAQKNYKEAEYHYQQILYQDPNHYIANQNISVLYKDILKDNKFAERYLLKCLEIKPDDYNTNMQIGQLYEYELMNYEKAEYYYQQAISLDPSQYLPFFRIGQMCFYDVKNYEKAFDYYLKTVELKSFDYISNYNLGIILRKELKLPKEAEKFFNLAKVADIQKADPHYALGELYQYDLQDYEQAECSYLKAIELDPKCRNAIIQLVDIYENIKNDPEKAQKYRSQANLISS